MSECVHDTHVFRCTLCGTWFELGVADPGPNGEPRCPQCGSMSAEPAQPGEDDFVVRSGTPFR
jgi:DNA-directed RNA polymerase subunit RPC12/RpoP